MKKEISIHEFFNIYQAKSDVFLIDVRDSYKYDEYHIPNSVNLPSFMLKKNVFKLPDKDTCYYVIDYDNEIASEICDFLDESGYDVCLIYGGIKRWKGSFN